MFPIKKMSSSLEATIRNTNSAVTVAPEGDVYSISAVNGEVHVTCEKRLVKKWLPCFKKLKAPLAKFGYDISFSGILKNDSFIVYSAFSGKELDFELVGAKDGVSFLCAELPLKSVAILAEGLYSSGEIEDIKENFGKQKLIIRAMREPGYGLVLI